MNLSHRNNYILLWFFVLMLIIFGGFLLVHRSAPKKPVVSTSQCANGSPPCIAILDNSGKVFARVNDFRFGTQGCIYYLMPSDNKWHEHCGGYTMQWIGPNPPAGGSAKI
jgi:hypothetical protein